MAFFSEKKYLWGFTVFGWGTRCWGPGRGVWGPGGRGQRGPLRGRPPHPSETVTSSQAPGTELGWVGFTWSWGSAWDQGSGDPQVKIQLRMGVGLWVRGWPEAAVGVWGPPCSLDPVLPQPPHRAAAHRASPPPALSFGSLSAEWVAGAPLSSPRGLRDQVTDNCPLLLAAPGLGWAPGTWPGCRGAGLVAGALPALGTQRPSDQQPQPPCSLAHALTLTSSLASPKVGGDLGLVPGTKEGSGARGCQGGGDTPTLMSQLFLSSHTQVTPPTTEALGPRVKGEGMEGAARGSFSRGRAHPRYHA